ncbi:MAG: hypothetical protein K5641_07195 [Lachnospiraceae bacterium]|nr:hypothetical protein [Lachnospiraceae bacterium]
MHISKIAGFALSVALLMGLGLTAMAKSGSKEIPVPADADAGAVVYSNVYGQVLITEHDDGTADYTFFDTSIPAVQQLMTQMKNGVKMDYTRLITQSSTDITSLKTYDNLSIPNDIPNYGYMASDNRGTYAKGSVYGTDLNEKEIQQVQSAVSGFMLSCGTASLDDASKVRTAHDYLVRLCKPAAKNTVNHRDNAWGALLYHEANSKGYARAFKAMCDAMGVGCYTCASNNKSSVKDHMWNVVCVNGNWYIVDVFVDDSTNGYSMYLLSDAQYEYYGMRWNKNNTVPVARFNYR